MRTTWADQPVPAGCASTTTRAPLTTSARAASRPPFTYRVPGPSVTETTPRLASRTRIWAALVDSTIPTSLAFSSAAASAARRSPTSATPDLRMPTLLPRRLQADEPRLSALQTEGQRQGGDVSE